LHPGIFSIGSFANNKTQAKFGINLVFPSSPIVVRLKLQCLFYQGNFKVAVALHYAYCNFVKSHKTIRCTPAVEAGVETSAWTVQNLVEMAEA
jgi:hypothetical protein